MMRLTLSWETLALGATLYAAVAFDVASVSTLYYENGWVHLIVYLVFLLLQLLTTAWYVWLIYVRKTVLNRHTFHVESARLTELYSASLAFVAFGLADFLELLTFVSDDTLVTIAAKMIFSSFGFILSLFGTIIAIVARQNRLSRLATTLDVVPVSNVTLIKDVSLRAQRRDILLSITLYWWFLADIVEMTHYSPSQTHVGVYVLNGVVIFIFFCLTSITVVLDALLEIKRSELRALEASEHL